MKKVLYTANVPNHILAFHLPYLRWLKEKGFEVHVGFNGEEEVPHADKIWNIPFVRDPYAVSNIHAYKKLKKILIEQKFNIVHCHTPIASAITRLASFKCRRNGTVVLYTVHGFVFSKDAPAKKWLLYLPLEWALSFITDGTITINNEDYNYLKKYNFATEGKFKINGIGIDPKRLKVDVLATKDDLRVHLGFNRKDLLVLYIAEFTSRKNHRFIINNIPALIRNNPDLTFVFAGRGTLQDEMKELVRTLQIEKNVKFLGFREDIGKFIKIADMGVSSSKSEGLGLGLAEMMFNNLPVVVANNRGHRALVDHTKSGFIFEQNNAERFRYYISKLCNDKPLRDKMGNTAKRSMNKFIIDKPLQQMKKIYNQYL